MVARRILSACTIAGLLLAPSSASHSQAKNAAIKTTVCVVAAEPSKFEGKLLEITAQFESDGIERTVLIDQNCKNYGIAPLSPRHYISESALTDALHKGYPGTLDKTITGTFIGTFNSYPGKIPNRTLSLQEVRNVTVVMK
jgi:hypothetical protein